MTNSAKIYHVTQEQPRKTGIASVPSALEFADIKSRTTLINMERDGRFPPRIDLGSKRVGYRWSDLHAWADSLQTVEGTKNGQ